MRKYILPILLIVSLVFGFNACKPESVPEKPDQEQPAPKPEPEPEPEPNPEPEPSETVIYYDNLDKVKSDVNNNYFNTWSDCRNMEGTGIATVTYDGSYTSCEAVSRPPDIPELLESMEYITAETAHGQE